MIIMPSAKASVIKLGTSRYLSLPFILIQNLELSKMYEIEITTENNDLKTITFLKRIEKDKPNMETGHLNETIS